MVSVGQFRTLVILPDTEEVTASNPGRLSGISSTSRQWRLPSSSAPRRGDRDPECYLPVPRLRRGRRESQGPRQNDYPAGVNRLQVQIPSWDFQCRSPGQPRKSWSSDGCRLKTGSAAVAEDHASGLPCHGDGAARPERALASQGRGSRRSTGTPRRRTRCAAPLRHRRSG